VKEEKKERKKIYFSLSRKKIKNKKGNKQDQTNREAFFKALEPNKI